MTDLRTKDEADQPRADSGAARNRRTPAWVNVLGIIVLLLLIAFLVSRLFGIQHSPHLHSWLVAPDLDVAAYRSA